jgi:zeaxanthin epoxidase
MMPNLGQGGCQALEDAYVLTEVLKNVNDTSAVPAALQAFYQQRVVRTTIVQLLSRLASDLIINAFDTPWSPHDQKGTNWKSYLTFAWKPILQYVIFPLQFAYLYSYHPTGSMGDLPAQLKEAWQAKHAADAEAAFKDVRDRGRDGHAPAGPSFFAKAADEKEVTASAKVPAPV